MGILCRKRCSKRRCGASPLLCAAAVSFGFGLLLGLFCSLKLAVVCAALLLIIIGISILTRT